MTSYPLRTLLLTALITTAGLLPHSSFATAQKQTPETAVPVDTRSAAEKSLAGVHERIKRCAGMQEISIRMSCYDDYAIELGYITPDRAKADVKKLNDIGMWQITRTDDGHGVVQTQLRLDSLNKLASAKAFERNVSLLIRCVPGKTEAMIDWKANVLPGRTASVQKTLVNYQTEIGERIAEEWEASTDKFALFAPDPIAFSRMLMNRKSMTFSFGSAGNSTSNVARFNIEGVEKALDEIVKACYSDTTKTP